MSSRTICIMARVLDQDDGLYVYSKNLLSHMFKLDPDTRYLVLLRTPKHAHIFDDFANVETKILPARIKLLWDQFIVPVAAKREKADLIFNPKFSLPLLTRTPGIFVLHGSDWYINPSNYEWWDNIYIRLMMPLYCRKASRLLSMSRIIVDDLERYASLDSSKVTVSYAAPASHFKPEADPESLAAFARDYALPSRFMLSVARAYHTGHGSQPVYTGGNIERLVHAYRCYRKSGGDLPLVIAGSRIKEYLTNRGFAGQDLDDIHFTGFIPHDRINLAYNLAEFFVLVTLYESFGHPLIESMASGCPVIVSSTGACPEVSGGATRLVDPRNVNEICSAMLELGNDKSLRRDLAARGLARAAQFSWDATARMALDAIDEALASKQHG